MITTASTTYSLLRSTGREKYATDDNSVSSRVICLLATKTSTNRMSPLSVLLLCVALAVVVPCAVAAGDFECSLEHICDFETKKCKHVTICQEYDNSDDYMQAVAFTRSLVRNSAVRLPADFVKFDTNVDKVITRREFVSRVRGNAFVARHMFVEADTNGDRCVTCGEFIKAPFWADQQKQRHSCDEHGDVKRPHTRLVK
ncbi:hypothetical protein LSAT2_029060 [Lamellibrachia satsuma]|nr:hypothetical protein LSAT2_029060 [Lamellibrachia satsuma]